ncbi:MAG: thioesterase family protein [Bacteroidia bacterium]
MARIEINFPDKIIYTTKIPVRITDINYGGHLGNDKVLGMMHEARMQFLNHYGYTELNVEGAGLIMADAGIKFKSEAFFNEMLEAEIAIAGFSKVGFDLYYRFSCNDRIVALGKTGMIFFDYAKRKIATCPALFETKFKS